MGIRKVGVVGCGLMGSGIAQVSAMAGFPTVVREVSNDLLKRGLGIIEKSLAKFVEKGTLTPAQKAETTARLQPTTDLAAFADCDLVIEAIIENLDRKRELFGTLDGIVKPEALFASNTSSLSVTEMMTATKRAPQFLGLHFFNPVPLMKLVEVVKTVVTDPAALEAGLAFAKATGKTPILTSDRGGFIVNRLLVPYLLDSIRALEEGAGSIVDIDNGMKLGCGHPMGPLTLNDFVGIDTTYYISEIMFNEFRERRFAAPPLMKRMVAAGLLGRKSGKGFYDYSDPKNPTPNRELER
ncbi:MAG TPA: 3-hydroxybutyryl-CoA dehydrogenase [Terriglobia bacterium]|jgi:3-hydroxybutyryl-CoA dehydrogenase|nr:3-hydroxybutyryl-CoA dehydrogenase [Terriglobia bacterium]